MENYYIKKSDWTPTDRFNLEDAAMKTIISEKSTLVIAGPGAGKTELLAQKACYLLQTNTCKYPQKILAISFKKDASVNLADRVKKRCGENLARRFESLTYDAFAKGLLDRFILALPEDYQPNSGYNIAEMKNLRQAFEIAGFKAPNGERQKDTDERIRKMLWGSKLPLQETEYNKYSIKAWQILLNGVAKSVEPCLMFPMISRLVEYLIRLNPLLKKALQFTYSYVFLDEFQDTTDIQYELVKTCFLESGSILTAVGDNKQRIMTWAGALKSIFDDYSRDFHSERLNLIMNHRSAPRLIELQKLMYNILNEKEINIQPNQKWNNDDGEAFLHFFKDNLQEANTIAFEINKLIESGTKLGDISILSKQFPDKYTSEIISKLNDYNIKARVETEYQDILKEEVTLIIINTLYLAFANKKPESWNYIRSFLSISSQEEIGQSLNYMIDILNQLQIKLNGIKQDLINCEDMEILLKTLCNILNIYGLEKIKSIFPQYEQDNYLEKLVNNISKLLWKEYQSSDGNWLIALENFEGLHSIPIMTIHKSKGLEYDTVFFIGLEDAAFWNFQNQPDEDRCAFFVALSRAKRRIDFTFCKNRPTKFTNTQHHVNIEELFNILLDSNIVEIKKY